MSRTQRTDVRSARIAAASLLLITTACIQRETTTVELSPDDLGSAVQLRSAANLPDRFVVVTAAANAGDCPPRLRDPGLSATLELRRSMLTQAADTAAPRYIAIGDYAVQPRGLYGAGDGEGLRVDCARLTAIGVVRLPL